MLSRVKFHRFVMIAIFIFFISLISLKRRYILLIDLMGSDMVHYPKNSWAIILAIFAQPLYYLTLISIFITFVQH